MARPQWRGALCLLALRGCAPAVLLRSSRSLKRSYGLAISPTVTHAQGLVGAWHSRRQGKGWFRAAPRSRRHHCVVRLQRRAQARIEAILAKSIDLTYGGAQSRPSTPTRNRAAKKVRIIAGAAKRRPQHWFVQGDFRVDDPGQLPRQSEIATPQLGNTQGRSSALVAGQWGDCVITQMGWRRAKWCRPANPDQFAAVQAESKIGRPVWTGRALGCLCWRTEAGGKQGPGGRSQKPSPRCSWARREFLDLRRDMVRKFAAAHDELTEWIIRNPQEAQRLVRDELAAETRAKRLPGVDRTGRGSASCRPTTCRANANGEAGREGARRRSAFCGTGPDLARFDRENLDVRRRTVFTAAPARQACRPARLQVVPHARGARRACARTT